MDLFGSGPVWSGVLLLATVILLVFLVWEFTAVNSVGGYSLVVGVSSGSGYPWKGGTAFPGVFSFCCGVGRCFSFVPVSLFILADFGVMSSVGSVPLRREPVVVARAWPPWRCGGPPLRLGLLAGGHGRFFVGRSCPLWWNGLAF